MLIDFYMSPGSSPCRSVMLTAEALGIADKLQLHKLDIMNGEHLKPDYVKLNPQHLIPMIVDHGFNLWESRTILRYLVNKYGGSDNPLYPADAQARAVVDQRLDFDLGTLAVKFGEHFYPQLFGGVAQEGSLQKLQDTLTYLSIFLEGQKYVAGNYLTIADLSLVATVSTIETAGISINEYPNIVRWYELVKNTAPNYDRANEEPLAEFKALLESKKSSN